VDHTRHLSVPTATSMQKTFAIPVVYALIAAVNVKTSMNVMKMMSKCVTCEQPKDNFSQEWDYQQCQSCSTLNPDYLDIMTTLKIVRLVGGYTLKDVERISNGEFTVAALGSYERNHKNITVKRLLKLCEVYGISIDAVIRHSMYGDQMHVMQRRKDGLRTTA